MPKKIRKWKLLKSKIVFDHRWYKVRRDVFEVAPGKVVDDYFVGVLPNIIYIVAITEDGKFVMTRQYKAGADAITLEVPAGDVKDGESLLKAAQRELLEETGYQAKQWKKLGFFYSNPTKQRGGVIHVFLAAGARRITNQNLEENENIEIKIISKKEVIRKIIKNEINVAGVVAAILLTLQIKDKPSQKVREG